MTENSGLWTSTKDQTVKNVAKQNTIQAACGGQTITVSILLSVAIIFFILVSVFPFKQFFEFESSRGPRMKSYLNRNLRDYRQEEDKERNLLFVCECVKFFLFQGLY